MRHYRPDKRCLRAIQIFIAVLGIFFTAPIAYISSFSKISAVAGLIIMTVASLTVTLYLPLHFNSIKYTATDLEFTVTKGVFIKRKQTIKFSSIQYTTVISFPLPKLASFNSVIFFVYGGKLKVSYLSVSDLREIIILAERGHNRVP